jgi:hypothetical protein
VSSLQFRADHRLHFIAPQARAKVGLPLRISWSMKDFSATGLNGSSNHDEGAFAVFIDQRPMPPGKTLKWLYRGDSGCARSPRCPGAGYLSSHAVYVTTADTLTLRRLPAPSNGRGEAEHYATVVLLDGTGRRIGESSWYLPFRTARSVS